MPHSYIGMDIDDELIEVIEEAGIKIPSDFRPLVMAAFLSKYAGDRDLTRDKDPRAVKAANGYGETSGAFWEPTMEALLSYLDEPAVRSPLAIKETLPRVEF